MVGNRTPNRAYRTGATVCFAIAIVTLASTLLIVSGTGAAVATTVVPSVASINPSTAENVCCKMVRVSGTGFESGGRVELERGGSRIEATAVTVSDSTTIDCRFDLTGAAAGAWNVTVTNPDGYAGTLPEGFAVTEAAGNDTFEPNNSTSEAYGPLSPGVAYTSYISRESDADFYSLNVPSGRSSLIATLNSIPYGCDYDLRILDAAGVEAGTSGNGDDTNEVVELTSPKAGLYYLEVKSWSGCSAEDSYSISCEMTVPPSVTSVAPQAAKPGDTVTVKGTGFGATRGDSVIKFGSVQCAPSDYVSWSATTLQVKVPAAAGGRAAVTVASAAGVSNGASFKVIPVLDSINPTRGKVGTLVTFYGKGFGAWAPGSSSVYFGSVRATAYTAWNNYKVTVKVPKGVSGKVAVKVATAGGISAAKSFTITK